MVAEINDSEVPVNQVSDLRLVYHPTLLAVTSETWNDAACQLSELGYLLPFNRRLQPLTDGLTGIQERKFYLAIMPEELEVMILPYDSGLLDYPPWADFEFREFVPDEEGVILGRYANSN